MLTQEQTKSAIIILLGLSAVLLLLHIRQMSQKKEGYGLTGGSMQSARLATGGLTSQAARLSTGLGVGGTQAARLSTGLGVGGTQAAYLRSVSSAQHAMSAHLHAKSSLLKDVEEKTTGKSLAYRANGNGMRAHLSTKPIGAVKSQVNPNTGAVQSGQIFGMKRK